MLKVTENVVRAPLWLPWMEGAPAASAWETESALPKRGGEGGSLFHVSHHMMLSGSEMQSWQSNASRKWTGKGCCQWDSLNPHSPTGYYLLTVFRKSGNYIPQHVTVSYSNNTEVNTFVYNLLRSLKGGIWWVLDKQQNRPWKGK